MAHAPSYLLTAADLDRLKLVAARVFSRTFPPQARLEILARSAGLMSYAALLKSLSLGPVLLEGRAEREERFLATHGFDPDSAPFIPDLSLGELVAAGLAWTDRHKPLTAPRESEQSRLEQTRQDQGTLEDYISYGRGGRDLIVAQDWRRIWRASLSAGELRRWWGIYKPQTFLLLSPANMESLWAADPNRAHSPPRFDWSWRIFDNHPRRAEPLPESATDLAHMAQNCLVVYNEEDGRALTRLLGQKGIKPHPLALRTSALWSEAALYGLADLARKSPQPFPRSIFYATEVGDAPLPFAGFASHSLPAQTQLAMDWMWEMVWSQAPKQNQRDHSVADGLHSPLSSSQSWQERDKAHEMGWSVVAIEAGAVRPGEKR